MRDVRIKDEYGEMLVRDSFVVAFFCRLPLRKVLKPFADCFEHWQKNVPSDAKRWCCVGPNADTYSSLTAQRLDRAHRQFETARIKSEDMRSLDLGGPQEVNPDYWFSFCAHEDLADNETNHIEIRFPTSVLTSPGVPWVLEFTRQIADLTPYSSGYASLGLTWGVDSQLIDFSEAVRGLAFRHPGLDVAVNDGTAFDIADKLRGAYWLTFIGPEALAELGGPQKLRKRLGREISMVPVGPGWMLQAGANPEPGDVNRGQNLPLLRSLAKVLEPVLHFNDEALGHVFREEEEDQERWERRFFAPEYGGGDENDSSKDDDD